MRAYGIQLLDQRVVGRFVLRNFIDEARVIPLDGLFLEEETASRALVVVLEALDHRESKAFAPHLDAPVVEDLFQQLVVVEARDSGLYIGVLISSGTLLEELQQDGLCRGIITIASGSFGSDEVDLSHTHEDNVA